MIKSKKQDEQISDQKSQNSRQSDYDNMSADEMKDIIAKDRLQYELSQGSKSKNMKVPKSVNSKS
jgi:hypothetical protein